MNSNITLPSMCFYPFIIEQKTLATFKMMLKNSSIVFYWGRYFLVRLNIKPDFKELGSTRVIFNLGIIILSLIYIFKISRLKEP